MVRKTESKREFQGVLERDRDGEKRDIEKEEIDR